ncbi:hypothetical protein EC844_11373 [Acinetobacter calcoaceticus]|uniref:Uncharacterized protein n=1 Tax=Acinetobacter calcoaceticus TaxID=471 RepID=A0A4R1Y343_ACICA|nr:hypothetical protein EC844_11373 [Acinetobacter calcoaceticus]
MCKYSKTDGDIVSLTNYIRMYDPKEGHFDLDKKQVNFRRYANIFKKSIIFDNDEFVHTFVKPHPIMVSWYETPAGEGDGGIFNTKTKISYADLKKLVEKTNAITLKEYTPLIKKKKIIFSDYTDQGLPPTKVSGYIAKDYGIYVFEYKKEAYVSCSYDSLANLIN